jgi:hypothetical protein
MNQYMHFNFQFDITTRCAQAHKICKNLHIYIDSLLASLRSQRFHRKKREKNPKKIQKIFPEKNSKKVLQKKFPKKISKKKFQNIFGLNSYLSSLRSACKIFGALGQLVW